MPVAPRLDLHEYRPKVEDYVGLEFGQSSEKFEKHVFRHGSIFAQRGRARDVLMELMDRKKVFITSETMGVSDLWLREEIPQTGDLLSNHKSVFIDSEKVMRLTGINHHDEAHQNRVATWGACWNLVHGVHEHDVKVTSLAARFHDNYQPYLEEYSAEQLASFTDKHVFDNHPQHAATAFKAMMKDSRFNETFDSWSESDRTMAIQTIRQHSNGSFGYDKKKSALPLSVKLGARGPDKLDNIYLRAHEDMLTPDMIKQSRLRKDYLHKILPFATRNQFMKIDKESGICTVYYVVDLAKASDHIGEEYTAREHIEGFPEAYCGSMRRAAEVAEAAFRYEGLPMANPEDFFKVKFVFVNNGERIKTHEESYSPMRSPGDGYGQPLNADNA